MKTEEFNKTIEEFEKDSRELLLSKGRDYTNEVDRLSNFKEGIDLGVTPLVHCFLLAKKQFNAIRSYVKGRNESEPIKQRLMDLSNFCKLMYCIIKEEESIKNPPLVKPGEFYSNGYSASHD